jgi:hypothetical protein
MIEIEAERQAIDDLPPDHTIPAEAVGFVLAHQLRGVPMEPLPWDQVDLLRAMRARERSGVKPAAPLADGATP